MSAEEGSRQRIEIAQERGHMTANNKAIGAGLPKPIGSYNMPPRALDAGHRAIRFNVCPAECWSCFGPNLPLCASILHF
jgi:hypothetical protein